MMVIKDTRNFLYHFVILIFFVVLISYTYFESQKYFEGPEILVSKPKNQEVVRSNLINLEGKTKNIKELKINDLPAFIDELGNFKEKMVLTNGYHIIKIEGKDKFNKNTKVILEINVKKDSIL